MGDPAKRDPQRLARDVRDGLVSAEAAQSSTGDDGKESSLATMTPYLLSLVGFTFASSVSPGPNNVIIASIAAQRGMFAVLPYMFGVVTGVAVMFALAGAGLAGLFVQAPRLARAGHAVQRAQLRAQLLVNAVLVALAEKIQIRLAQRGQEGIRIAPLRSRAIAPRHDDIVGINLVGLGGDPFEQPGGVDPFQFDGRAGFFVDRHDVNLFGLWGKNPRDDAGAVGQEVHAQKFMGRMMLELNQTVGFCLCQNHAEQFLALPERDARLPQVVGGHFHVHLVAHADADEILAHLAGNMGQHLVAVGQRHAKHRPRQDLRHLAVQFNWLFFRHSLRFVSGTPSRQTPRTFRGSPVNLACWMARNQARFLRFRKRTVK